ncbi:MAG: RelA/SpoT family protein [Actinobacteria bacterium]|uniref:Unannotated protein n=1 Tax=freshwater metagenome TaxID=449393 RepID=A0A6J7EA04_9ZZZZ|nr:RelA/SpoT family protein [Actinomycetota bacterium]
MADFDPAAIAKAWQFAENAHSGQTRLSGEPFIDHPLAVAEICAGFGLDTQALQAAILHDTVEDTAVDLEAIEHEFGPTVAELVDGVTKLTELSFQSRDEEQAENYRKMIVAMTRDIRVILIKLADRLHNMRTVGSLPKQKQAFKAKESLDIYAPIAHRLGIHAVKSELEDLAFATLHPRKYQEIKELVSQQRAEREEYVAEAGRILSTELESLGVEAAISGRAKHFYSIYSKMSGKAREFNEIYDLTAMRVVVDSIKDCYSAVGAVHALWKPLPGRFKDYVAMPKLNRYQSLHTTVIGPEGRPLEIQIRTRAMHETAEFGVAAHWRYKRGTESGEGIQWLDDAADRDSNNSDSVDFLTALKGDLFEDEVFIFTPRGEVKSLAAGATPLDFAYDVHTDVGHRCVGAKVNGRIVPLSYQLRSGDIVEVLTSNRDRGPSRDWLTLVRTPRAKNKIRAWFRTVERKDAEQTGRESLNEALKREGLPAQKIVGSSLLADVTREVGFRRADELYRAIGSGKVSANSVVQKVLQRLKQGEAAEDDASAAEALIREGRKRDRPAATAGRYGIAVADVGPDVMLRMAKCCRPVPGDDICGYVSLGRGITIHRTDCLNVDNLSKDEGRFTPVRWEGQADTSFRVELQVDGWDRHRLLEDLSRTFAETGINIVEARVTTDEPMIRNRFVVEVPDTRTLELAIAKLRQIDAVFDAQRVTPSSG